MTAAIAPKKAGSGEHPEVKAMKAEMLAIRRNVGGRLHRLNKKLDEEVKRIQSDRPAPIPRRDTDSPIPTDVVTFPDPEPSTTKLRK